MRRWIEALLAAALLLVLAPLLLLIGIAVRCETPGPSLYRQTRTGHEGRRFRMYKFRTMHVDHDPSNRMVGTAGARDIRDFKATPGDGITRLGRVLRRTSLDELPQLWNIVRGDMRFIGPRPTSFATDVYDVWHTERLSVPPGLTGLAQVHGRHELSFDERCRLDIRYVATRSARGDVLILLRTLVAAFAGRGA